MDDSTGHSEDDIPLYSDEEAERLEMIHDIVQLEWDMLQQSEEGKEPSESSDDWETFHVMRESQYDILPDSILLSMLEDLHHAEEEERNLMTERYSRMLAYTDPDQYEDIEPFLPEVTARSRELAEQCISVYRRWMQEHALRYPNLSANGIVLFTDGGAESENSEEISFRGELLSWSEKTLALYRDYMQECAADGINLVIEQDRRMVQMYGFDTLEEAEERNRAED